MGELFSSTARAADRHRRHDVGDDQVRLQRLPGHQAELRQRRGRPVRGGGRRRPRRPARPRLRQAHRLRVPAPGPGLGRVLPAQGHPGPAPHRRAGRATTSRCWRGAIATNDEQLARVVAKVEAAVRRLGSTGRRSRSGGSPSRPTPTTGATRRAWRSATAWPSSGPRSRPSTRPSTPRPSRPTTCTACSCAPTPTRPRPGRGRWSCSPSGTSSAGSTSPRSAPSWPSPPSSTPATCSTRPRCAAWASPTRGSGAGEPGRGRRRAPGFLGSHLCDRLRRPGRHRRLPRRPLDRARRTTWPTSTGHDALQPGRGRRQRERRPVDGGPVDAVLQPGLARRRRRTTWPGPSRPWPSGSEGTRRAARAGPAPRRTLPPGVAPARSTATPRCTPRSSRYRGNVNPIGPAQRLRRGQALRREPDHGHAPHPRGRRRHRPHLQHLRPPALARATAGSCPTSSCRPCAGEPLTVYGDGSQTRSLCFVDDEVAGPARPARLDAHRPGQHREPRRAHHARAGPLRAGGDRVVVGHRPSSRCPTDDPTRRCPDITLARPRAGLGADDRPARRASRARSTYFAEADVRAHDGRLTRPTTRTCSELPAARGPTRSLTVIVPVFNERTTVAEVIRRMRAVELPAARSQVIVVDDGSSDGTDKVLGALEDSTVRVITPPGQPGQGCGHPHRAGRGARRPRAHPGRRPRVRPQRLAEAARPDPARARPGSSTAAASPASARTCCPLHWIGNRLLSLVTNVLYSSTLSDMETCYKLFDAQVLEGITIVSNRFDFEPEITAKVLRRGLPDLRGADLLRRPRARRGEEDHLARRLRRPARRWSSSASPRSTEPLVPGAIGAVVVDHDAGPLLEGCVRSAPRRRRRPGRRGGERRRRERRRPRSARCSPSAARAAGAHRAARGATSATAPGSTAAWRRWRAEPAPPEWVLVSNPDLVVHPGALAALRGGARGAPGLGHRRAADLHRDRRRLPLGAHASPPSPTPPGTRCWRCSSPRTASPGATTRAPPTATWSTEADWVSGSCFLARRSALEELGGFDEAYFMYAEDMDLCWRAHQAGWGVGLRRHGGGDPRPGRQHRPPPLPHDGGPPPLGAALHRPHHDGLAPRSRCRWPWSCSGLRMAIATARLALSR